MFGADGIGQKESMRIVVYTVGLLVALALGGTVGFVVGAIVGQHQLYQTYMDMKIAKIRPALIESQFKGISAEFSSAAQVYLTGTVPADDVYKSLEERLRFLFGDEEARFMMSNVEVAKKAGDVSTIPNGSP